MASRNPSESPQHAVPRLYLVTPPAADPDRLAQALAAADIAAVLLQLAGDDERALLNGIKALAPIVQSKDVAFILDGHPDLVGRAGVDGSHLAGIDTFNASLPTLKPQWIAGCGGLATRHDAMLAAEGGADYVLFGEPQKHDHRPSFEAIVERIEWWAQVFEIPCVGYAASLDEIAPLSAAGADFVAVGPFIFDDPRGPAHAVADAAARLVMRETVA